MIEVLRSHSAIPFPPTPLIGREDELAVALSLLRDSGVRLVTLLGPGGVGKTRLALELAHLLDDVFADGVSLLSLEALTDAGLVPATIANAAFVGALGTPSSRIAALEGTRGRDLLLVLDSFEHVLAAAPAVAELLAATPGLTVLVTSREPLHLCGEHCLAIAPLPLLQERWSGNGCQPDQSTLAASPAVTLFAQRARAARADFTLDNANVAAVTAICARLDGLPLAIELAAARVSHLSPAAILERIDRQRGARLSLLTGGPRDAPPRQRTIRDAIAWSHDHLADHERVIFRRLAVLPSGFTIAAAAAVCATGEWETIDGIRALLDKSLLNAANGPVGEPRFGMLETTRAFAWEQLMASGEEPSVRQLHAAWLLARSEPSVALAAGGDGDCRSWSRARDRDAALAGDDAVGPPTPNLSCLTPREHDVLRLLAQGLCDKEIAAILLIRPQTATKHVGNLLHKLGMHSRTAAATLAVRRGYV